LRIILARRSVRSFAPQALPEDVFAAILEAGRVAPSTVNLQTWTFLTFTPASWQATFGQALPFGGQRAVLVLGDTHRARAIIDAFPASPLVEYTVAVMNASLAAMNMNIAAEALGVSSVMLSETGRTGFFDTAHLAKALRLPPGVWPLMTIVFGYAHGPRPPMPPKLPRDQVAYPGTYREPDPRVLQDWLAQMVAGYKAMHPRSSFDAQLQAYQRKIGQAEAELDRLLLGGAEAGPKAPG
jgi:nitroreductase